MTYFVFLFVQYSDREGKNKNFISIIFKFLLHCYQHGEKSFLSFLNLIWDIINMAVFLMKLAVNN